MAARRKSTPSYLEHKQSGKGRAVWTDAVGIRHQKLLPGAFESAESREAFARLLLELATSPVVVVAGPESISVNELLHAYYEHAEKYYADADGKPTKEIGCMKSATKPVRELYGELPAAQFGPLAL